MRKNILIKNALLALLITIILAIIALSASSAFVKPQGNDCYYCHKKHYEATTTPNHTANNFPTKCDTCHRAATGAWRPATSFNHADIQTGCYECHKAKYDSTTNPNHASSGFPTTCEQCHKTNSWKPATFSHTKFTLTGKHIGVECSKCHLNNQYQGTPKECYACHWTRNQRDPWKLQLGQTCNNCHNTSGWKPASWSHSSPPASWSLTGSHLALTCLTCHPNYDAASAQKDCYSCHKARYDATTNPNHASSGFPTTCEQCHNTTGWKPATFSHTKFPLTGQHATVACAKCHVNNQYIGTPKDCYSCHKARYDSTATPKHSTIGLGTACEQCHNTSNWKPSSWKHSNPPASWTLTGSHTILACTSCHINSQQLTGHDCYSCHKARYDSTTNPNHISSGFPTTCEQCHNTTGWKPATFSHTKYPLTGLHITVACAKCHLNNQYIGTPKDCYTCHWVRNQRDPWKLLIGQNCEQCHKTSGWKPASWSHSNPPASWTLTGKHAATVCIVCHTNYQAVTSKECYSCHKVKYDATVNPKHSTIGFNTTCEQCHNTTVWKPATWSHSSPPANWPLTGFHTTLTCVSCHPNSQQLTSKTCYSCHKARYDASANPKHSAAKIGTVCENCHNTSAWTPGKFNHATDAKGAISSKMASAKCNNCHPNNNDYTRNATKCLGCHKKEHHQDPCAQCHYTVAPWDKTR